MCHGISIKAQLRALQMSASAASNVFTPQVSNGRDTLPGEVTEFDEIELARF